MGSVRMSERFPGIFLASSALSYQVRAVTHVLTWSMLVCTAVGTGALYLLNDTPFQAWVAHITPTNGVGEHDTLAAVVSDPQVLFLVLVMSTVSVLLIAAGGLRRARR